MGLIRYSAPMQRGLTQFKQQHGKGAGILKGILTLLILGTLVGMGAYVYFAWQKADLSVVDGREKIINGDDLNSEADVLQKLVNARNGNYVVTLTEEEVNAYLAKKLKLKQGGPMKGFASIKGIYVDFTPDLMEVFIEREIAQYGEDGKPKTEYLQPFDHTVSMKYKIYTVDNGEGKGTKNICEFPGATIGKSPAPGMFVKMVKQSFDKVEKHFKREIELASKGVTFIKIEEGKITFDPRKRYKKIQ